MEQLNLEAAVAVESRDDDSLNPWFSSRSCFPPMVHLTMSRDIFGGHNFQGGVTGQGCC